jgi:CrcB protein
MLQIMMIGIGGALGSILRFLMSSVMVAWLGRDFPFGTLTINVLGSFLMGLLAIVLVEHLDLDAVWRTTILVGFLGGFTTFSSFSLETLHLFLADEIFKALLYMGLSVVLCVGAAALGLKVGQHL